MLKVKKRGYWRWPVSFACMQNRKRPHQMAREANYCRGKLSRRFSGMTIEREKSRDGRGTARRDPWAAS